MIEDIPDNFYRVSVKALILDEQKRFLLCYEEKELWDFPGGGLDFGETPEDCLVREIREEMGLEVVSIKNKPCYFLTAPNRRGEYWIVNVFYEVQVKNLDFTPSTECTKIKFFNVAEAAQEDIYPNITKFLELYDPSKH